MQCNFSHTYYSVVIFNPQLCWLAWAGTLSWVGIWQTEALTVNVSSVLLRHCCYLYGQAILISQEELYVSRNNRLDWAHSLKGVRLHGPALFNRWYLSEGTLPCNLYHSAFLRNVSSLINWLIIWRKVVITGNTLRLRAVGQPQTREELVKM